MYLGDLKNFTSGTKTFEKMLKPKHMDTDLTITEKEINRGIQETKKVNLLNQEFGHKLRKTGPTKKV